MGGIGTQVLLCVSVNVLVLIRKSVIEKRHGVAKNLAARE